MRVLNCASQESFRVFDRCLTSLMQIAFFQAKYDYFSDIYEVVPEANVPKSFVCFALAANGTSQRRMQHHSFKSLQVRVHRLHHRLLDSVRDGLMSFPLHLAQRDRLAARQLSLSRGLNH